MSLRRAAALMAGFGLDLLLGDPEGWPHPVRLIGKQIQLEEGLVRDYLLSEADDDAWPLDRTQTERLAGAAVAADAMLVVPLATWALVKVLDRVHPAASFAAESVLCYQLLAARSLRDASMQVHDLLQAGDVPGARRALARIVGRDTDQLDESDIARAAVETVAENASDGVVAPMLFQALGGVPAMMLYKAVNTLDSMVGYRNERYQDFGRFAARMDDAFNIVPSRITAMLMCLASTVCDGSSVLPSHTKLDGANAWRVFWRDRNSHPSPNSAQAEAACAGALGIQLGGPSSYGGVVSDKPVIGGEGRSAEAGDIVRANRLMYAAAVLALALAAAVGAAARGEK